MSRSTKIGLGLIAGLALVVIVLGAALFIVRSRTPAQPAAEGVPVTVTASACEPNAITVPAGRTTFRILNKSERAVEWEILDGVMVLAERENIAPGFTQTITARLEPGAYQITCGLLSNPRGTLTVTPAEGPTQGIKPDMTALIGAVAEYKVYLMESVADLADATSRLGDAVKAGDLGAAQAAYAPARRLFGQVEPIAKLYGDLGNAIDVRAAYLQDREKDAGFTGFHRLEYGLFDARSTDGLAPVADKLNADVGELSRRIGELTPPPDRMISTAASVAGEAAATKIDGGEPYAHVDLETVAGNFDAISKVVELFKPATAKADKALGDQVDAELKTIGDLLARHREGDAYQTADKVGEADAAALKAAFQKLSEDLGKLRTALGLE